MFATGTSASADLPPNGGHSLIGICHPDYPCEKAERLFDGEDVIRFGFLGTTFGTSCPCVEKLIEKKRPKVVRVHAVNGPCLRNKRCGRYEPFAGETIQSAEKKLKRGNKRLLRKVERAVQVVAPLIPNRGDVECYCSAVLETDFSQDVRRKLGLLCQKHLPHCRVVDNPTKLPCVPGMVCEVHGSTPRLTPPCIADIDGELNHNASAFFSRYRRCIAAFDWYPRYNCLQIPGPFIDPRRRQCRPLWN